MTAFTWALGTAIVAFIVWCCRQALQPPTDNDPFHSVGKFSIEKGLIKKKPDDPENSETFDLKKDWRIDERID